MILLAAPAVTRVFSEYRQVFGYLKAMGIHSFHNVLLRADIAMWAYVRWLETHPEKSFFSSPCAAVSAYVRSSKPHLLPYLLPGSSPLGCAVTYLRKYKNRSERIAFLSPCVAKRHELREQDPQAYTITVEGLQQYLVRHQIDVRRYSQADFSDREEGTGATLAQWGGMSECLKAYLPERRFIKRSGQNEVYSWMEQAVRQSHASPERVFFAELYNCPAGCEGGTGVAAAYRQGLVKADSFWFWKHPREADNLFRQGEALFSLFDNELRLEDFLDFDGAQKGENYAFYTRLNNAQ